MLKVVVRLTVFLSSANLICRSTDISKCFIESLGFRDNESRLYMRRRSRILYFFLFFFFFVAEMSFDLLLKLLWDNMWTARPKSACKTLSYQALSMDFIVIWYFLHISTCFKRTHLGFYDVIMFYFSLVLFRNDFLWRLLEIMSDDQLIEWNALQKARWCHRFYCCQLKSSKVYQLRNISYK